MFNSMKIYSASICILLLAITQMHAQENKISWKKTNDGFKPALHLFHSTQSINFSTTETLEKGNMQFEISHRFIPTVNEGIDALYGFDGPVNVKLSLAYALTDDFMIALARSNVNDNLLLRGKYKFLSAPDFIIPVQIALEAGFAWNTNPVGRSSKDNMNFQYYSQLIFNTLIDKKLGIGLVPTYLYNSHIYCPEKEYSFTLGTNVQYYISSFWSVIAEWNPTISGFRKTYNTLSLGVELETGGHFFKIILTNNATLSPTQFITGAELPITVKNWHIGFNITRLLNF
jgi:hypothetical protein